MDIINLTAWEMREKLINKEISSVEIVEAHFSRIDEVEDNLNAFISLNYDGAVKSANIIDAKLKNKEALGVLAGIPIGLKDNIVTKGMRTTCGSKMLEHYISPFDATVVERIYSADGIIVGKTNMDEFAMGGSTETSYFGATKNPYDSKLTAGGSSGGSAAAVAINQVALALGTDTGGSVRQPAAFSNVIGIKPTYGLVSRYGVVPMANTLDQVGVFGRDVKDAVLMLNAVSGHDSRDLTSVKKGPITIEPESNIKGMKIGIIKEFNNLNINKSIKSDFEKAIMTFQDAGGIIEEISIPSVEYAVEIYHIISSAEASSNMARFDGIRYGFRAKDYNSLDELYINTRTIGFGEEVKKRILMGTLFLSGDYVEEYYQRALRLRTLLIEDFKKAFKDMDIILTPTTTTTPYELDKEVESKDKYNTSIFTVPANLAGLCALSMPCDSNRKPSSGLQIIGDRFKESNIIKAALGYERVVK